MRRSSGVLRLVVGAAMAAASTAAAQGVRGAVPSAVPGAAPSAALAARVDSAFAPFAAPGSPGCALTVVRDGRTIYEQGYGLANLEYGVPITPATVFYAGSVSKQFTAAAILLLAADGKLRLTDDVRTYIPELPDYGRPITLDHLIHHTSGVRDYLSLFDMAGRPTDDAYTDADVYDVLARQRALNFPPGERYAYSNSGYWLLGQVVKRVSGKSLRAFTDERIFAPLGMTSTHFHDDHTEVVPGRAYAYASDTRGAGDRYRIAMPNFDLVGAGGLLTTVRDLARWDRNFYDGTVGGRTLLAGQLAHGVLAGGDTLPYAFGLQIGRYRGLRTVAHTGSYAGYRAEITRFPDVRFSTITLCNLASAAPEARALRVADIFLAAEFREPAATTSAAAAAPPARSRATPPALAAERLPEYAGTYASEELLGATYMVAARDGRLWVTRRAAPPQPLAPTDTADVFLLGGGTTARFTRDGARAVDGFTLAVGRAAGLKFVRVGRGTRGEG